VGSVSEGLQAHTVVTAFMHTNSFAVHTNS
jgi:hypothetical protein